MCDKCEQAVDGETVWWDGGLCPKCCSHDIANLLDCHDRFVCSDCGALWAVLLVAAVLNKTAADYPVKVSQDMLGKGGSDG